MDLNSYDLFIFDLDDTLINTEYYHYNIWLDTLKSFIDDKFYFDFNFFCSKFHSNQINGIKNYIINELNLDNYDLIINKKNENYFNFIKDKNNKIKLVEGVNEFINFILSINKKFIIVTNNSQVILEYYLELFPILKNSIKNYYREIFKIRKPNPACYLKVIEDFPTEKKIIFEDSITGIHALYKTNIIIDTIFINDINYYYYNEIMTKYKIKKHIKNYFELL